VCGFEKIIGQTQPIRILTTLLQNGNVPHALTFIGNQGIGKHTVATIFAMLCNCVGNLDVKSTNLTDSKPAITIGNIHSASRIPNSEFISNPCGVCKVCRKIKSGSHPDIILIKPSGQFIKIEQIRDLRIIITMRPYSAKLRVVIIDDAQTMNPAAANALLKVLEEPPDRTVFILIAKNKRDLLPTITSRCQPIRFHPIPLQHIEAMLITQENVAPEKAAVLAAMSYGSFSKALSLLENDWISRRDLLIRTIWPDTVNARALQSPAMIMALAARFAREKDNITEVLDGMKSWLRDLLVYRYCPEKMINYDLIDKIHYMSEQIAVGTLLEKLEAVQIAQRKIRANANLRLTLDTLFMQLTR